MNNSNDIMTCVKRKVVFIYLDKTKRESDNVWTKGVLYDTHIHTI